MVGRSEWSRSMTLCVADAGAVAKINTTVTVRNTASNKIVLLSGIEIEGATGTPGQLGMLLENNASHVRVQGCTVRGGEGDYYANNAPGGYAVSIVNSTKVAFVGCSLTGGMGGGIPFFVSLGGRGGDGVVTHGSIVAFYDCLLKGGIGGQADYISPNERAGDGGDGCHVLDYGILASGCQFQGGMGGGGASIPGDGGNGLRADAGQAQYIGSTFAGGSGGFGYYGNVGANGQPQIGSGVFNQIAGSARKISAPALAAENSTLQVQLSGEPGDRFWLLQTRFPEFIYSPSFAGVRLVLTLALSLSVPHATLPAAGTVTVPIFVPDVGVGTPVARQYWQCLVVSASGQIRLGSALHVAVLNCSDLMPDCDGNGSCDSCVTCSCRRRSTATRTASRTPASRTATETDSRTLATLRAARASTRTTTGYLTSANRPRPGTSTRARRRAGTAAQVRRSRHSLPHSQRRFLATLCSLPTASTRAAEIAISTSVAAI